MNKLEKRTIFLNTLFNLASALMSTFVSVYLYVYTDSLVIMTIYTIIRIGLFPVSFILGSKIAKKVPFTYTYALGLILITCSLIYILIGKSLFELNRNFVYIAAVITGIGEGFYYFSANTCNQIVSNVQTRANFLSYNGIFTNITSLLAPFVANLIINGSKTDMDGYRTILIVTVVIFIFVVFIAMTINKKSDDKDVTLKRAFSLKDPMWKDHQLAVFSYGLMNSLTLTAMNILIFDAAGSGNTYSRLQAVFALITIISYRLITKNLNKEHLNRTFLIGVVLKSSAVLMLVYCANMFGAIYYGIVNAIASAFYDNSYNYLSAYIIGKYPSEMTARVVTRECSLSLGRCVGMGFIVLCYLVLPESLYIKVSITTLTLTPIIVERLMIKYKD